MEYSKLSDFEINLKVAHIILGSGNYDWSPEKKEVYLAGIDGGVFLPNGYFDPCNNPADAWPIIVENKISISNGGAERWTANDVGIDNLYKDKNPLRAAMIVFLLTRAAHHA
ncbi:MULTISPECIES: phage protein NinX family protein [Cronobacter]|uniref:phage protein NinX family protein n=1 Tax=Cronobacter TaxID=413496 RepID=UPI000CFCC5B4|nr:MULTISPECIES: phage protein NinX family protein [Cronobacter]MDT3563806.1 phage protein NinX family protein [Cronobacter malonaticus]